MDYEKNMELFNSWREVPKEAQKKVTVGRTFTDINPMWRIAELTKHFGICGIGWKYTIDKQWLETSGIIVKAFCNISLFVKVDGQWSDAIPGQGGSEFCNAKGVVNDECYKMALTDAISVSCKALGIGADIYWEAGRTKYQKQQEDLEEQKKQTTPPPSPKKPVTTDALPKGMTQDQYTSILAEVDAYTSKEEFKQIGAKYPQIANYGPFRKYCNNKYNAL